MHVLITGGTGFIGQALTQRLLGLGYEITLYCRDVKKANSLFSNTVNTVTSLDENTHSVDVVINLAGEPIADKRWTDKRKSELKISRVGVTNRLVEWLSQTHHKPSLFISGSATGIYGNHPEDKDVAEETIQHDCFSHELCSEWEAAALEAEALGVRVCLLRTSVVLAKHGGALPKMAMPYKLGLGGAIASGNQWFPWIHLDDMLKVILYLIENQSISGPINAVAPESVSNKQFSRQLAKTLSRPCFFTVPGFVIKALLGESAELLLEGQKVIPKKLIDTGFTFQYSGLASALDAIYLS